MPMFQSHPVLRRYTPPTCTLEVKASNSPLSRWAGQPVVKHVQFQLNLDDPKLPEQQWITIQGDRTQLDALSEAVTAYIQDFLQTSHEHLTYESTSLQAGSNVVTFTTPPKSNSVPSTRATNSAGISLQPRGLLSHNLFLGSLATSESGSVVPLSTLQLFDLSNALDEYSTDVLSLPNLSRSRWSQSSPAWAQIAAVLLIAVGLSTSAIKLLDGPNSVTSNAPTSSQGASSSDQRIATQLPPAVAEKATPPVASGQTLPSPSPGVSPSAKSGAAVTVPKMPTASPSPTGQMPPGAIAPYPVPPTVPGAPTIIAGEAGSAGNQQAARSQSPKAPAAIAARPVEPQFAAPTELNQQAAARGRATKNSNDAASQAGSTAFDTIPQVAEARSYFQQRWKPPEGLTQVLEYSLQIDPNGTIQSITPLKQASADYIDRTGLPLLGEPFVSPVKGGRSAKIRLVLEPNGKVQTFLE